MAIKGLNNIDDKLTKMYENKITTLPPTPSEWVDKSQVLFAQMNFIALNNKALMNLE